MKIKIIATIFLYLFSNSVLSACEGLLDEEVKILNEKKYQNLCEYSGKTILVVTHEEDIAQMCKRIVRLKDGVIVEDKKIKQKKAI